MYWADIAYLICVSC